MVSIALRNISEIFYTFAIQSNGECNMSARENLKPYIAYDGKLYRLNTIDGMHAIDMQSEGEEIIVRAENDGAARGT